MRNISISCRKLVCYNNICRVRCSAICNKQGEFYLISYAWRSIIYSLADLQVGIRIWCYCYLVCIVAWHRICFCSRCCCYVRIISCSIYSRCNGHSLGGTISNSTHIPDSRTGIVSTYCNCCRNKCKTSRHQICYCNSSGRIWSVIRNGYRKGYLLPYCRNRSICCLHNPKIRYSCNVQIIISDVITILYSCSI
ncbi:hypothetical protein D9M68_185410 [compost metagenome]